MKNKNKSKSPFKKAIEENLKVLNKEKKEYLETQEKKKLLQEQLKQNGYKSIVDETQICVSEKLEEKTE